ncbi:phospholipase [Jeongeupia chitinilytica]|uniref:phospholipase n=1 Tax=Jeongeupia chitinilytica TaxID=1041641 RepID=UPI0016773EA4|nr:phospholipase [Jeongeupia chitinilytica]
MNAVTLLDGKPATTVFSTDSAIKNDPAAAATFKGPAFSIDRPGNKVQFFTTGKDYYDDVAAAIENAQKSIFITGWQINFDVLLTPGKRLLDCLAKALKNPAVRIYIMPWCSPKAGLDTNDFETMLAVFLLNAGLPGPIRAFCMPAIEQSDMGSAAMGFSHHQKLVVIDNKYAYVGGIDLAYGRRDDNAFSLKADSAGRKGREMYNSCIPPVFDLDPDKYRHYLTTAELFSSALMEGDSLSKVSRGISAMRDAVTSDDLRANFNKSREEFGEWLRKPSIVSEAMAKVSNAVTDEVIDRAGLAYAQLPKEWRKGLENLRQLGGGYVTNAAGAVFGWLNNCDLSDLPSEYTDEAAGIVRVLGMQVYAALMHLSDQQKTSYSYLMNPAFGLLPPGGKMLDASKQPRMPWQDVHSKVEGPSVYDLSMNFVRRWNSIQGRLNRDYKNQAIAGWIKRLVSQAPIPQPKPVYIPEALLPKRAPPVGSFTVQVLRSAPRQLLKDEEDALSKAPGMASAERFGSGLAQDNCQKAIVNVIEKAKHFLYIEGQFFQSEHGDFDRYNPRVLSGPMGSQVDFTRIPNYQRYRKLLNVDAALVNRDITLINYHELRRLQDTREGYAFCQEFKRVLGLWIQVQATLKMKNDQTTLLNRVGEALARRIEFAINRGERFHVYMVLPVHPEGTLDTLNIMTQVFLTQQSLHLGSYSLINRIRGAICVKRLMDKTPGLSLRAARDKVVAMPIEKLEQDLEHDWKDYLTLLNLRNWDMLDGKPVTEQIYVHSKLVIADDLVAVLGSANINDRSLQGDRDSELAIWVKDGTQGTTKPITGGTPIPVSPAIHQLRVDLWKKHFGLSGKVRPANELAGVLEKPADPATWKAIQKRAQANAATYETSFPFIPRNDSAFQEMNRPPAGTSPEVVNLVKGKRGASLWPGWRYVNPFDPAKGGELAIIHPWEPRFWDPPLLGLLDDEKRPMPDVKLPRNIAGFIVALPVLWTAGENNYSGMNLSLLAQQGMPANTHDSQLAVRPMPDTGQGVV